MKLKQTKHGYQAALFTWSWYSPGTSQDSWAVKAKRSHDSDRKGTWTDMLRGINKHTPATMKWRTRFAGPASWALIWQLAFWSILRCPVGTSHAHDLKCSSLTLGSSHFLLLPDSPSQHTIFIRSSFFHHTPAPDSGSPLSSVKCKPLAWLAKPPHPNGLSSSISHPTYANTRCHQLCHLAVTDKALWIPASRMFPHHTSYT